MCCLFGFYDYGGTLSAKQKNRMIAALAAASEVRGIDATGIAYCMNGHLSVYKRPLPAHWMRFRIPEQAAAVMGHTRMTTQGSEYRNYNNHPFSGKAGQPFALAHNGVLTNDGLLRRQEKLPVSKIETDSRFLHLYGSGWRRATLYRAREQSVLPVPLAGTGAVSLRLHAGGAGCGCVQDPEAVFRKYAENSG